ncbi:hypothetical protein [Chitinophaga sp. YIM B06452]|uniref:hypothetical protein n=1 Tax=Chitinophaga sp. YIM B06452 TaxID=3082158 RepID=UPI0031FEBD0A
MTLTIAGPAEGSDAAAYDEIKNWKTGTCAWLQLRRLVIAREDGKVQHAKK